MISGAISELDAAREDFAWRALENLDGLHRYAMSLTQNRAEAEDLVQESYCRAIRAAPQLAPQSNVKSWIYAILRNAWLNQVRHRHSGPVFTEMDGNPESGPAEVSGGDDPYATYVQSLERDAVRKAVNGLPGPYREVIILREFEGLSYEEIGEVLQLPRGTVMSRLARARDRLRITLSPWGNSSGGIRREKGAHSDGG